MQGPAKSPLFPPPPDPGPRYLLHTLMSLLPTAPVPAHLPTPKTAGRDTLLATALSAVTPQSCHFGLYPPLSRHRPCNKMSGKREKKSLFRVTRAASGPRVRPLLPPFLPDASRSSRLPCVYHFMVMPDNAVHTCPSITYSTHTVRALALPGLLACTL